MNNFLCLCQLQLFIKISLCDLLECITFMYSIHFFFLYNLFTIKGSREVDIMWVVWRCAINFFNRKKICAISEVGKNIAIYVVWYIKCRRFYSWRQVQLKLHDSYFRMFHIQIECVVCKCWCSNCIVPSSECFTFRSSG